MCFPWVVDQFNRNPLVSFLYERGWRQNFNRSGFPGPDEEVICFHLELFLWFKKFRKVCPIQYQFLFQLPKFGIWVRK